MLGQGPASRQTRERPCVGLQQQYRYWHLVCREPRNRKVKVIPIGECPQGMAFSPDNRRLYVTNMNSDSISVIDTQSKKRIGEIPTGKGPVRIGVTPDGKTLVYALQTGEAVGFANAETRKCAP